MATKTIGQLTQATTINNADEFAIEQSGVTKRVAASVVRGDIVNANIKSDAAIAYSKLAALNSAQILVGNGSNVPTAVSVTGDVTISNAGVTAIGSAKVLPAMLSGAQTGSAPIYGCRAWVNFDGTTVTNVGGEDRCTIRGSGNVTKVVRNNTGDYTITFSTAMPDANYATVASGSPDVQSALIEVQGTPTTTTQQIYAKNGTNNASANFTRINVAIFG